MSDLFLTALAWLIVGHGTAGAIAVVLFIAYQLSKIVERRREKRAAPPREGGQRWDSTEAEVDEWADMLAGFNTQPDPWDDDVSPGTQPTVYIAPSPLRRKVHVSHHSAEQATGPSSYVPRHAVTGPRPWRVANLTTTQLHFAMVLEQAGEEPPAEHGPREKPLICTRTEGVPALTGGAR